MKYALLDTSFILSCIKKKIDFFEKIPMMGMNILIPSEVILEIKGLAESESEAEVALRLLDKNKFEKITLNARNVDNGIVKLAGENKEYIIATLDREIKNKVKNHKLVIRGDRELEIIP